MNSLKARIVNQMMIGGYIFRLSPLGKKIVCCNEPTN